MLLPEHGRNKNATIQGKVAWSKRSLMVFTTLKVAVEVFVKEFSPLFLVFCLKLWPATRIVVTPIVCSMYLAMNI